MNNNFNKIITYRKGNENKIVEIRREEEYL